MNVLDLDVVDPYGEFFIKHVGEAGADDADDDVRFWNSQFQVGIIHQASHLL